MQIGTVFIQIITVHQSALKLSLKKTIYINAGIDNIFSFTNVLSTKSLLLRVFIFLIYFPAITTGWTDHNGRQLIIGHAAD